MNVEPILEVRDLVKDFAGHRVIDGVSLRVTAGDRKSVV